jgi:hypothetical protein
LISKAATLITSREPRGLNAAAEDTRSRGPVIFCLVAALAGSATLLLIFQSKLTFTGDDWSFLIERRGRSPGVFLDPHHGHISVLPVTIYKALLSTFGMSSSLPFSVVSTLVFLLSAVLLFVYLRRRVGDWPALLGAILILFLGAAWNDLLWSFQIGYSGPIAAGLAALLALERDDPKGDLIACGLLVVATSFSEIGIPFVLGGLASIAMGPKPRRRRLYVGLVPLALYAIWFLGWGHKAPATVTLHNVLHSPAYVFDAVSQAIASLLGLATPLTGNGSELVGLLWGHILFVCLAALAIWRIRQLGGISRGLLTALTVGGAFWFLAAFNATTALRLPTNGRYVYPGAVFVLLIASELLRGVRVDKRVLAVAAAVTAAAVVSGIFLLHDGYVLRKNNSGVARARLAALDIARPSLSPQQEVPLEVYTQVPAGSYYSAVDAFGSPGYTESQLARSSDEKRVAADVMFESVLGIRLTPSASRGSGAQGHCRIASPTGRGPALPLGPGAYDLMDRSASGASLRLSRFGSVPFGTLGTLSPGKWHSLVIPPDRSDRPWHLTMVGSGPVRVCSVRPS